MAAGVVLLGAAPAWAGQATSSQDDSKLSMQCPAAAKWIDAMERKHAALHTTDKTNLSNPALRDQLAKRVAADQKVRERAMGAGGKFNKANIKAMLAVDAENLAWLKPLVKTHGFPTKEEVGKKGVDDAWLLVQHADKDPAFQASVLKLLKARLGAGGISKNDYALLVDRVRLAQGKEQLYGSQIAVKNGTYVVKPTKDMAHVDTRRESMNLMPISSYLCVIKATYGPPSTLESKG